MYLTISRLTISLLLSVFFFLSPNATRAQQFSYSPTIPLAVRSPYLNCWLQYNRSSVTATLGHIWPTTSNFSQTLGWSVLVRVDNQTYSFLGDIDPNLVNGTVNSTFYFVSPSSSTLTGQAGPMLVNFTFINPIEPQDWVKQSIPFSYMSFTAQSTDGASHHVQVYSDVSGEWTSGDRTQKILWNTTSDTSAIYHTVTLRTSTIYTEILDQPEWGTLYFATPSSPRVSYQSGSDADSRGNFTRNGNLNLQQDQNRSISDGSTVFALAYELNNITATQAPVIWAIGYTTDFAINYTDLSGAPPTPRSPYYKTRYPTDREMMVDFLNDFSNASSRAQQLEGKIFQDSDSVAQYLSSLTSLALAEVYGSMQLTISTDGHGNLNKSDVMVFMKNIGGIKNNRVNAVETLYAAFPALMYIDPSLGAPLLEPLLRLQASRNYTIGYAAADLGSNYPSVSCSNSNHSQGVEQTGNMLIMTYAYARASGDGSLISRYYSLLTSWADYLIASTLFIHDQSSADSLTVNNQTNLAIKGIIAIETMSKMSSVVKQTGDTNKYSSTAASLYSQWKSIALGSDQHLLATYGQGDSWTLGYNLFADVWLGTQLVEQSVYNGHSNFINNLMNLNFSNYGMPIDNAVPTDSGVAVSSWTLFVAAMTSNQGLCSELIFKVVNGTITSKASDPAFAVYYDAGSAAPLQGVVSPALGAMYAPLALKVPTQTINADGVSVPGESNSPSHGKRNENIGAIVGGGVGGAVALFTVISIATFVRLRRRRARPRSVLPTDFRGAIPELIVTPFNPYIYGEAQDSRLLAEQRPLVTGEPDAGMVSLQSLSATPPTQIPIPQLETQIPVGLSDKEIAMLRAQSRNLGVSGSSNAFQSTSSLDAPLPQPETPVPVGLPDGEMARLRAQSRNVGVSSSTSSSDVFQTASSPNAVSEPREAPMDSRRLHSEVEYLVREEMERLRAQGLVIEPPPSYSTEGGG